MSNEPGKQLNTEADKINEDLHQQLEENLRDLGLDEIDESQKSYRYRRAHGENMAYHGSSSHGGSGTNRSHHRSSRHGSDHHSHHSSGHSSGHSSSVKSDGIARPATGKGSETRVRTTNQDHAETKSRPSEAGSSAKPRTTDKRRSSSGQRTRSQEQRTRSQEQRRHTGKKNKKARRRQEKIYKRKARKLRREQRRKRPLGVRILIGILITIAVLLVAAIITLLVLRHIGKNKKPLTKQEITGPEDAVIEDDGRKIIYKGHTYLFNDNIVSILFLGVDRDLSDDETRNIGEAGQADTLVLGALDTSTGHMELVNISRDTFTDVIKYNTKGEYAGTEEMQICLAYSYGDGKDKSCLNTAEAVSKLMYGMPIHTYAAIDYSQMAALNDAVDGVTVKVLEDLQDKNPAFVKGATVHLEGQQAQTYVRSRRTEELESNTSRMERQMQYIYEYLRKARQKTKKDFFFPVRLYRFVQDNTVTSVDVPQITYLASRFLRTGFSKGDVKSIPGTIRQEGQYAALTPDETKLFEMVLETFYEKQD